MEALVTGIGWVANSGLGWGNQGGACHFSAAELPVLTRQDVFPQPNQRFGRMSEYAKLGVAALAFALRDAGLEAWSEKRDIPIFAATSLGSLATDVDYHRTLVEEGAEFVSPNLFAYTLANCFLGDAAIQFGLTGSSVVINETKGGLEAVTMALHDLAAGEAETALAGICDLTPPEPFPAPRHHPGALFLVLQGKHQCAGNYGAVTLADDGGILYHGSPVHSLIELAQAALAQRKEVENKC